MFTIGQKIKFIVNLPIGESGICEGIVAKILPPRNEEEGPSFLIVSVVEDGQEMADYRIDTLPSGSVDEGTMVY